MWPLDIVSMALATIFQGRDMIAGSLDPLVGANKTWHASFVVVDSKGKAQEALMLHLSFLMHPGCIQ
jgi:hypothetical protein